MYTPWYWNFSCVILYLSDSTLRISTMCTVLVNLLVTAFINIIMIKFYKRAVSCSGWHTSIGLVITSNILIGSIFLQAYGRVFMGRVHHRHVLAQKHFAKLTAIADKMRTRADGKISRQSTGIVTWKDPTCSWLLHINEQLRAMYIVIFRIVVYCFIFSCIF